MHVQPYLMFEGRADEAIEFYKRAVGAKVTMLMRNNQSPEPHQPGTLPPGSENKVLHASLRIGDSTVNLSDGSCSGKPSFSGTTLSLSASNDADAERLFNALVAEGGTVHVPLTKTFFSSKFGMLADRFGVSWMVLVGPQ